jgi:energy-coupling factor transporter ATP-binding protein EcfA2
MSTVGNAAEASANDLYLQILEKLIDDDSIDDRARSIVDGALRGDEELAKVLATAVDQVAPPQRLTGVGAGTKPPRVFLKEISVRAFRGAGPRATLALDHRPGLTLVVGRNGTGKSTFADGLETLLTGTTQRWSDVRSSGIGWKNLGSHEPPEVTCNLIAEGIGPCRVTRTWDVGANLADGKMTVVEEGVSAERSFDWKTACASQRPFLGYRQLSTMVEDPTKVFDALHGVLGLELFDTAEKRVDSVIKRLGDYEKEVSETKTLAETTLARTSDPRGALLLGLLQQTKPELEVIEARMADLTTQECDEDPELVRFSRTNLPTANEWEAVRTLLEDATSAYHATHSTAVEGNDALLEILEKALPRIDISPEVCPICRSQLDSEDVEAIHKRADALRTSTRAYREAEKALKTAQGKATELVGRLQATPIFLHGQFPQPLTAEAIKELASETTASPERSLGALKGNAWVIPHLASAQTIASAELGRRGLEFRKLTLPLEKWLRGATEVGRDKETQKALKKAKGWLKTNAEAMRSERFAPLEQATVENWKLLGADSSVLLKQVKLVGSRNKRNIDLQVEVDGESAPGVAVLSQGEVNCMALSLFLPRAIEQDGPFRFVLIDDPVQAMDQLKVDGLAQVLHNAAKHLQVVVFTHDTRLVNSVRRLQLQTTILEVQRKANSELIVRRSTSPVQQYLSDANAVAISKNTGDELPGRVVPGFCRMAVEAACQEQVYRTRLTRGVSYEAVDETIRELNFFSLVALALFDDESRGDKVADYFTQHNAPKERQALFDMKKTHGNCTSASREDLKDLVHGSREICRRITEHS